MVPLNIKQRAQMKKQKEISVQIEQLKTKYGKNQKKLNEELQNLAQKYQVSKTTIATAWILRHPAGMQVITGTTSENRITEIICAENVLLTREEWYRLYLAAGHVLP